MVAAVGGVGGRHVSDAANPCQAGAGPAPCPRAQVSVDRIRDALQSGAVPGRRDDRRRHHWVLTAEDVDAVERYFRELAPPGAQKGGAAGLEQAKTRSQ
jgi:hypothetical protein